MLESHECLNISHSHELQLSGTKNCVQLRFSYINQTFHTFTHILSIQSTGKGKLRILTMTIKLDPSFLISLPLPLPLSVCMCLCVCEWCMHMCVQVHVCAEAEGHSKVSSSITLPLVFCDSISHWTENPLTGQTDWTPRIWELHISAFQRCNYRWASPNPAFYTGAQLLAQILTLEQQTFIHPAIFTACVSAYSSIFYSYS